MIGLVGGAVLASAAGARRTDTAYARFLRSSRAADVLVSPFVTPDAPGLAAFYTALSQDRGVATLAQTVGMAAVQERVPRDAPFLLTAAPSGRLGRLIERPKITAGRMYVPSHPDEGVIEPALARQLHVRTGSVLHLLVGPTDPTGFLVDKAKPAVIRIVGVGLTRDGVVAVNAQAALPSLLVTPALLRRRARASTDAGRPVVREICGW